MQQGTSAMSGNAVFEKLVEPSGVCRPRSREKIQDGWASGWHHRLLWVVREPTLAYVLKSMKWQSK